MLMVVNFYFINLKNRHFITLFSHNYGRFNDIVFIYSSHLLHMLICINV